MDREELIEDAIEKILKDKSLRFYLMTIIDEYCKVNYIDTPKDNDAIVLLAQQSIGRQIFEDLKCMNFAKSMLMEHEYREHYAFVANENGGD